MHCNCVITIRKDRKLLLQYLLVTEKSLSYMQMIDIFITRRESSREASRAEIEILPDVHKYFTIMIDED